MKTALITGVTGQDGSYLAEFLLEKGYDVHGLVRRTSSFNRQRLSAIHTDYEHRADRFSMHYGDLTDSSSLIDNVRRIKPDEIYNLGAQSHVHVSFEIPEYTAQSDALGVLRLLEVIRTHSPHSLFGNSEEIPQSETTPFQPRSPYATAKLYAYWIVRNYREAYGLYACNGILFNHESPRRGETFVTRKIVHQLCKIKLGVAETLFLGNLDARRDWGYAPEYVEAMWLMLQRDHPEDFVIATGENHSVREFVDETARILGFSLEWSGSGANEVATDSGNGSRVVAVDPRHYRPTEVPALLGDAGKASSELGWAPKVGFDELVRIMVDAEMAALTKQHQ